MDIIKENVRNVKESLSSGSISYTLKERQPIEVSNEKNILTSRLESLSGKEERIKASYREGIDTLEEYKANKALLQKERIHLEEQLKELEDNAPKDAPDPAANMLLRVQGVYDILVSDSFTAAQKNEALKQIVDKIIYDREQDSLKIYYFLYQ